ncbi:MAG TPA: hypothetical protein VGE36_04595 [Roseateles sp.]
MNSCRAFALTLLMASTPTWAINKCTMPDGRVVYQEAACGNEAKSASEVKTWTERKPRSPDGRLSFKEVEPNLKVQGPPEAKGLLDLYRRWADADRLARTTGRIALAGPVASLQALQREAEAVAVPECLFPAHRALTTLITRSTESVLLFMGKQETNNMVYELLDKPKLIPEFESSVATARCGER